MRQPGASARFQEHWKSWVELGVKVRGLPPNVQTKDLWLAFSKEGEVAAIEIFEDSAGIRDGGAKVSPPPGSSFWIQGKYAVQIGTGTAPCIVKLELEPQRRSFRIPSPVNPQVMYPETMMMLADSISFGLMYTPKTMMNMYAVQCRKNNEFRLNLMRREIDIKFSVLFKSQHLGQRSALDGVHFYRFRIPFAQVQVIYELQASTKIGLLIAMQTPPSFFRRVEEVATHEQNANFWSSMDAWYRQTDIVLNPRSLRSAAVTLKKSNPVIDIGRWTTYLLTFDKSIVQQHFPKLKNALKDFNIDVLPFTSFTVINDRKPAVWEYIDKPIGQQNKTVNDLEELITVKEVTLPFALRYQLEVCISHGCLNEYNLGREIINKLLDTDENQVLDLLEYAALQKKRIFKPMDIFNLKVVRGSGLSRTRIPHYCIYTRSATVTPTTIYFNNPTIETSNRVVRQYAQHADRFLRVRFTDEKVEGNIYSTDKDTMDEVFTRIKRTMNNGIRIGDRHFEFLAFGNSQLREHGAYFFARLPYLGPENIRQWMGDFSDIFIPAKYAARLGQCFSSTRAIHGTKVELVEIPDVKIERYNFTDGVGKISKFLALLAASELGVPVASGEPPSVFQFRLGGCKGVLAVSPDCKMKEIHIRESQYKFPANHEGLEIIRWSQFASASLNRQIISILSSLGVDDEVFIHKLREQLSSLSQAMTDEKIALAMLQRFIDPNQMTLTLAGMIVDGFQHSKDPFMISLLKLWRAWSIKHLKEKAKIIINDGACLLGCTDETRTLRGHFEDDPSVGPESSEEDIFNFLPQVFVQLSKGTHDKPQVITGPLLLARNPSLHPGDIRVVCGVDVPALRYLKDVVVLPQTGDRDVANMCSGGDLDGDDYLVMWDKSIIPTEWNHEPMDYTPEAPLMLTRQVTTDDITSFYVTYMKNDLLPKIARAHTAQADFLDDGVKDEKCLRLTALHSKAVDYVKSGQPADYPAELRPRKWPHFMETKRPKEQIYTSKKVLGKLYDQVERVNFEPEFCSPFDSRILTAYELDEQILKDAADVKEQYDLAVQRIMAQHDIATEFEIWTTFVMYHSRPGSDYKFHEEIGNISGTLKSRFRDACIKKAGSKEFSKLGPFVAAMYTVTSEQMAEALVECREIKMVGGQETRVRKMSAKTMPLMSFPWIFHNILGKIATRQTQTSAGNLQDPTLSARVERKKAQKKHLVESEGSPEDDLIVTQDKVTHRGELLELFQHIDEGEQTREHEHVASTQAPNTQVPSPTPSGNIANAPQDSIEAQPGTSDPAACQEAVASSYAAVSHSTTDLKSWLDGSPPESQVDAPVQSETRPAAAEAADLIEFDLEDKPRLELKQTSFKSDEGLSGLSINPDIKELLNAENFRPSQRPRSDGLLDPFVEEQRERHGSENANNSLEDFDRLDGGASQTRGVTPNPVSTDDTDAIQRMNEQSMNVFGQGQSIELEHPFYSSDDIDAIFGGGSRRTQNPTPDPTEAPAQYPYVDDSIDQSNDLDDVFAASGSSWPGGRSSQSPNKSDDMEDIFGDVFGEYELQKQDDTRSNSIHGSSDIDKSSVELGDQTRAATPNNLVHEADDLDAIPGGHGNQQRGTSSDQSSQSKHTDETDSILGSRTELPALDPLWYNPDDLDTIFGGTSIQTPTDDVDSTIQESNEIDDITKNDRDRALQHTRAEEGDMEPDLDEIIDDVEDISIQMEDSPTAFQQFSGFIEEEEVEDADDE